MRKIVKKSFHDIKVNDILAEDVVNENGVLLACRGTIVTSSIMALLLSQSDRTYSVLVDYKATSKKARRHEREEKKYEKLIDKAEQAEKLVLSKVVKERVAQGVEYIYTNAESEKAISEAAEITDSLLQSINRKSSVRMSLIDLKISDEYTFKHSVDVATMAIMLGKQLKLSGEDLQLIGMAGILHDIGKTKIANSILNKPGKLTDEEFATMKMHTVYGYNMLQDKKIEDSVKKAVLHHHERMDGTGYPLGIAGDEIGIFARILTVVDVFDALVTERPYHKAFTPATALEMLMTKTMHFDMDVLKAFLDTIILYPVGTIVNLSNGERAKVIKNIQYYPQRPVVVELKHGHIYDLCNDVSCASIIIV